MSVPSIDSVIHQMQSVAAQAGSDPAKGQNLNTAVGEGGFADALHTSIDRINQLQQTSKAQTRAFESGNSDLSLNEVMVSSQKAGVAFEMGVQVRNRLVTAYKDIMSMQV
ncbi:MAG: flagellar hook-basal body complex protein FliE [Pseudohongiellaceae bacterium]